jgi:hypothetical protein
MGVITAGVTGQTSRPGVVVSDERKLKYDISTFILF